MRSKYARRISSRFVAGGEGERFFSLSFWRINASIGLAIRALSATSGTAGRLIGWKDQNLRSSSLISKPLGLAAVFRVFSALGHGAPIFTHSTSASISFLASRLVGGISSDS